MAMDFNQFKSRASKEEREAMDTAAMVAVFPYFLLLLLVPIYGLVKQNIFCIFGGEVIPRLRDPDLVICNTAPVDFMAMAVAVTWVFSLFYCMPYAQHRLSNKNPFHWDK